MKRNALLLNVWISVCAIGLANVSTAQLYDNAANFRITKGGEVFVNGTTIITGDDTDFHNEGKLYTRINATEGDLLIENDAYLHGTGDYDIENHWINNAHVEIDSGTTFLTGDYQEIKGDSSTSYFNLNLQGTGVKRLLIDTEVRIELDLNDRELATHEHTMFVINRADTAIINEQVFTDEGFISTDNGGRLVWIQDGLTGGTYKVPLGSDLGVYRYRPVHIKSEGTDIDSFEYKFFNYDPGIDGYLTTAIAENTCRVNDRFYHSIKNLSGEAPMTMDFFYIGPVDDYYNELAYWKEDAPMPETWQLLNENSLTVGAPFSVVHTEGVSTNEQPFFALAIRTPAAPEILGDTNACYQLSSFQANPADQPYYDWEVLGRPDVAIFPNGESEVEINWDGPIGGTLELTYIDSVGCVSYASQKEVMDVSVHAEMNYITVFEDLGQTFEFYNLSENETEVTWWIDDFRTEYFTGPLVNNYVNHFFPEEDSYLITLIAGNDYGCLDTTYARIETIPAYEYYIPNTFTPDGDRINEFFKGYGEDVKEVQMQIFNRWGELIYEELSFDPVWDGTYRGEVVADGVYIYRFLVWPENYSLKSVIEYKGHVSVVK